MKKTLLASAIAGISFSGSALAMESASELAAAIKSMPQVYGNIQYVAKHTNVDGGGSTVEHADNGSTLGIKHDHDIAPGVTGFFKLELEGINADNKGESNGIDSLDEAYIGVKGDFGQVWVGSDDGTYERAAVVIGNFHEVGSDIFSAGTTGEGDQIQYMSPSFGGLTLGTSVSVIGDGQTGNGSKAYPWQFSATYAVDALSIAFAVDSNDDADSTTSSENTYGLVAKYDAGNLSLVGEYQTRKDFVDIYGVMATYALGANQFNIAYQVSEDDASGDSNDTVTLQALHNLSGNMYVYAEGYLSGSDNNDYTLEGASGDEQTIGAVGAVYYF